MNDRKRISLILAVMVLTTIWFLALFFKYITPQYRWSYDRAVVDKVNRANKMGHPKLLFVGNSATAFGYRCMTIEESLDYEYYLANLGMHGSLGNSFHENMAKDALEEGDIVILCHTDYQGETWPAENCMYDWIAIENDYETWKLVPKESWWGMVEAFPYYAKKCVRAWHTQTGNQIPAFGYSRADFNEYGDDVYCDGIAGYYQPETEELAEAVKFDEEGIKRVNEFNA
ncbi:MAG: hypothetical protein HUJ71_03890, partial [Pseudobutyrivibrio sp.]|nr:hypothetical protein [Pseudobutyrivibrio sp.]